MVVVLDALPVVLASENITMAHAVSRAPVNNRLPEEVVPDGERVTRQEATPPVFKTVMPETVHPG